MPNDSFYLSRPWKEARAKHLRMEPYCRFCALLKIKTQGQEVDHITAIEKGGLPFDQRNLRTLCKTHHSQKTFTLDKKSSKPGRKLVITGEDGYPIHTEGK